MTKNWIPQDASKGARSSATIYSIVVKVKANGLFVDNYLVYLMDALSNLEDKGKNIDMLMKYTPWSSDLSEGVFFKNNDSIIFKN